MMLTLLQRGFQPGANPPPNLPNNPAFAVGFFLGYACVFVLVLALSYGPYVLILVRQMQALGAVRGRNRAMAPGLVWLGLIPLFTYVWTFVAVSKTATALADESDDRRLRDRGDNGKALGMTYSAINLINGVLGLIAFVLGVLQIVTPIGCLNFVLLIAMLVVAILYAGKLNAATHRLRRNSDKYDDRDDEDDREDDFEDEEPEPKPKKRKPKLDDDFEEYDEPKGGR